MPPANPKHLDRQYFSHKLSSLYGHSRDTWDLSFRTHSPDNSLSHTYLRLLSQGWGAVEFYLFSWVDWDISEVKIEVDSREDQLFLTAKITWYREDARDNFGNLDRHFVKYQENSVEKIAFILSMDTSGNLQSSCRKTEVFQKFSISIFISTFKRLKNVHCINIPAVILAFLRGKCPNFIFQISFTNEDRQARWSVKVDILPF